MILGTAYFVNRAAAIRYYADQGDGAVEVDQKIASGEIFVGKPGDKLMLVDEGKRYAILEGANA